MQHYDVIIIGGGQSGLSVGYYLRRTGLSYTILDHQDHAGGAWLHTWKSLRLFSPAQWSSLPGMIMPGGTDYYPTRDETIAYLQLYESRYDLNVQRPVTVKSVVCENENFKLMTTAGEMFAKVVVNATGTYSNPIIPKFKGIENFRGIVMHSSQYQTPELFAGKHVVIVGEGNSGAQILAEVSKVANTLWVTQKEPRFLPDHIDGRYLFDAATQMYEAQKLGKTFKPPSLGDIVMVAPVKEARERNILKSVRPFSGFTANSVVWDNGDEAKADAVIFCTGFKAALTHLSSLNIVTEEGKVDVTGTRARDLSGLWFVGYGNWTGFASATLIGVGRTARTTVDEIKQFLAAGK
jgi:putative flavoprotein involved in K+ transport